MDISPPSTSPSSKRRAKFLVGGSVILAAIFGLVVWAMARPGAQAFYVSPSELTSRGATDPTESVRLNGRVVPGSIEQDGLTTAFAISDGRTTIPVTTDSPVPDTFKDRSEVVARGSYDGQTFTAVEVLAKCPSKFKQANA